MLNKEYPKPHTGLLPDRARGIFLFGPFRLDAGERVLLREDEPVALTPKAFDTLLVLISHGGRLVEKDRLLEEVWHDTYVEEKTLAQNVLTIRKALGKTPGGTHYIETIPKHGYRFAAQVHVVPRDAPAFVAESRSRTEVVVEEEYETDDDVATGLDAHILDAASAEARTTRLVASAQPAPVIETETKRKSLTRAKIVAAVAVAVCLLVAAAILIRRGVRSSNAPFQQFELTKLTSSGDVGAMVISPDGKYAAYTTFGEGRARLLVRQVDSTSSVEIVPPAEVRYAGLTFSNDGSSIYYVTCAIGDTLGVLYQIPVFGGTPKKIIEDVDSPVAVSPDGRRLAFVRISVDQKESALVVADATGGSEQKLAVRRAADGFALAGPTWSPDGRLIACASNANPLAKWAAQLLIVNVADGSVQPFSTNRWSWIGRAAWLADGKGIILVAWDNESQVMSDQIWYVSYPGGEARRITNDVSGFGGVSLSRDAKAMLAAHAERVASFWSAPLAGGDERKLGGSLRDLFSDRYGVAWAPDGKIVYSSASVGNPDIWVMDADGSNRRQLTTEPGGNITPVVSPDGRFIVFLSYRTGKRHIWRMKSDGGDPRQLTSSEGDVAPTISPDGEWIVYSSYADGEPALWKVPLGGGEATQLTKGLIVESPAVSPDGRWIACYHFSNALAMPKLALVSFADGTLAKEFDLTAPYAASQIRWTPDGRALVFISGSRGVSNFWLQPLDGTHAKKLTSFNADRIFRFDLSRDGRLIYERGTTLSDAILFRSK
jgi:Tol biopolymer transport system component/DNA-binding winged helix-turn-helix (wHTH) protein